VNTKTPLSELKGIGSVLDERLRLNNLKTVGDLIDYFPRRYDDYSHITSIMAMRPGLVSIKVKLNNIKTRRARRGIHITEADAVDASGKVRIIWFNQPYRANAIRLSETYYLSGEFGLTRERLQIVNPSIEQAETEELTHTARILPIYRESAALNSVLIRKLITRVLFIIDNLPETLPGWLVKDYELIPYAQSIRAIHLPTDQQELQAAKKRLGFEELFVLMLASEEIKNQSQTAKAIKVPFKQNIAIKFVENLPFKLTDAQRKCVWQIYKDIDNTMPMNRLIEGDVGSGKTVVAAMASLMVAEAGLQVAFVAPTELLAQQHAETLAKLLSHSPLANRVALLTGSVKPKIKRDIKDRLKNKEISILVGTHALFQESVDWHKLGLAIIDEQHRFGVEQRQKLYASAGHMPHILCLTATPIPRSLALTVYGELEISILDQAPDVRAGTVTKIVSPNSTTDMYEAIKTKLKEGRQAYVVCPLIQESDKLQTASTEKIYEQLKQREFKDFRVGLLHGKMKPDQKDAAMSAFVAHKLDVLVSTTVIEVGVDVPNATEMIIMGADRFGLAQLHQLRGRVGRAQHKGHCYLIMSDSSAPTKRMQAIEDIDDGFKLAQLDLELRGPGAIYGIRQHGILDLRIAELSDSKLIAEARSAVKAFKDKNEDLLEYKQVAARVNHALKLTYLN
jgi:ATP-dependent DNA helicase RecG